MDCNASDASVADWLEVRLRDELKLVEGRQRALLTDLRLHLRQVSPAVRVIPPGVSGSLSPSLDVKTARGLLRPPEAVKEESEQVGVKEKFGREKCETSRGIIPGYQSLSFMYVIDCNSVCNKIHLIYLIYDVPNRNEAIGDSPLPGRIHYMTCFAS